MDTTAVVKKIIFFCLVALPFWTFSKVPFYMAWDPDSDFAKNVGISATINLVNWIHDNGGFQANKLKSPAVSFFLIHVVLAVNTLLLIAATLVFPTLRRRFGNITYGFGLALAIHALPACAEHRFRIVFVPTCIVVSAAAILGFRTLRVYDKNPALHERHLEWQHYTIALGAWGAGFAELGISILPAVFTFMSTGTWPHVPPETPHPMAGKTFYDNIPESLAWRVYLVLMLFTWLFIPVYYTKVNTDTYEEVADRTTHARIL